MLSVHLQSDGVVGAMFSFAGAHRSIDSGRLFHQNFCKTIERYFVPPILDERARTGGILSRKPVCRIAKKLRFCRRASKIGGSISAGIGR